MAGRGLAGAGPRAVRRGQRRYPRARALCPPVAAGGDAAAGARRWPGTGGPALAGALAASPSRRRVAAVAGAVRRAAGVRQRRPASASRGRSRRARGVAGAACAAASSTARPPRRKGPGGARRATRGAGRGGKTGAQRQSFAEPTGAAVRRPGRPVGTPPGALAPPVPGLRPGLAGAQPDRGGPSRRLRRRRAPVAQRTPASPTPRTCRAAYAACSVSAPACRCRTYAWPAERPNPSGGCGKCLLRGRSRNGASNWPA